MKTPHTKNCKRDGCRQFGECWNASHAIPEDATVEAVARVLFGRRLGQHGVAWEALAPDIRAMYLDDAIAAIRAINKLRTP